jgi:hypothetical protein
LIAHSQILIEGPNIEKDGNENNSGFDDGHRISKLKHFIELLIIGGFAFLIHFIDV